MKVLDFVPRPLQAEAPLTAVQVQTVGQPKKRVAEPLRSKGRSVSPFCPPKRDNSTTGRLRNRSPSSRPMGRHSI
jgi:hypothetical protein